MSTIAKQIATLTKNMTTARLQTTIAPDQFLRTLYDQVVETMPTGRFRCRPRVAEDVHQVAGDWQEADSLLELLAICPPTPQDEAFLILCDHALMNGQQDRWRLRPIENVESPNRPVTAHIIEVAHLVRCVWEDHAEDYRMPPEIGRGVIYPPWDLGEGNKRKFG